MPAPVPENLTRLLRGKTALPLPLNSRHSQLIHKEDAATWSKYFFTREAVVKFPEGVSLGAIESLPTDPTRVRRSVHKSQRTDSAHTLVAGLANLPLCRPRHPERAREDPPDSPKKVDIRI